MIAKAITLFDQTGSDMDKACLATFLAESLFAPTVLLQDYMQYPANGLQHTEHELYPKSYLKDIKFYRIVFYGFLNRII